MSSGSGATILLSGSDIDRLLDMSACIAAVEEAFRARGLGEPQPGGVLGVHVGSGGYHVKAASLGGSSRYFAAKLNANFPDNPATHSLPTIQGLVLLSDTTTGTPLAVMDSGSLTRLRTAAASAVATKYLARSSATTLAVIGCGAQAEPHVRAVACVRALQRVVLFDTRAGLAAELAGRLAGQYAFPVVAADTLEAACGGADIVATCTPARQPFLGREHVAPGALITAVGADAPEKREIRPELLRRSVLVTDDTTQCSEIGELHHVLAQGESSDELVRAELGAVVAGTVRGRLNESEVILFDSTGIPIEDVAAAGIVYERAMRESAGSRFAFRT